MGLNFKKTKVCISSENSLSRKKIDNLKMNQVNKSLSRYNYKFTNQILNKFVIKGKKWGGMYC